MNKQQERDKKGRFTKGHKGGPGRPKGEPRDIICKDGKKRSVDALIDDLLATYGTPRGRKVSQEMGHAEPQQSQEIY